VVVESAPLCEHLALTDASWMSGMAYFGLKRCESDGLVRRGAVHHASLAFG
jgi:hypothetical protein